ncbi:MAG: hypothetical protein DI626_08940 [Micavibrio aeruginosavorus]|uniref:Uncharacterized protein n=1 Tax=Micavibrio aeruginosavorus TaxID=349221 RepID=A0A2W5BKE8_9BACT|nr:MAG: hypothetical protein DI626_08940 [Micavibrio aeruginosavorus]
MQRVLNLEVIQYAAHQELDEQTLPHEIDHDVLSQISEVLFKHRCEKRFGIKLLNKKDTSDSYWMETTDTDNRVSVLNKINITNEGLEDSIPTIWSFNNSEIKAMANCRTYCSYKDWKHTQLHVGYGRTPSPSFFQKKLDENIVSFPMVRLQDVSYTTLEDMDDLLKLNVQDETVLEELRDVILKNNYQSKMGIAFLHKHFEVEAGEIAIEYRAVEKDQIIAFVGKKDLYQGSVSPQILRFVRH